MAKKRNKIINFLILVALIVIETVVVEYIKGKKKDLPVDIPDSNIYEEQE